MTGPFTGRTVVFAGPSLPTAARPADESLLWLPPAMAGDTVWLRDQSPRAVVLIDGLFETVPSVRHKELLALMAAGVPVIGGASMGALRAAELDRFGMIGVGKVYAAFAEGRLTGDDEVALVHGPRDWDWTPLSEALVNVRATLQAAVRAGAATPAFARTLRTAASAVFYKERTWPRILRDLAEAQPRLAAATRDFAAWLPGGRADIKRADALACLERARGPLAPPPPIDAVQTIFSRRIDAQARAASRSS